MAIHQHTCTPAHMYTSTHVHQHTCTPAHMYSSTHVQQHTRTPAHTYTSTHVHQHTCTEIVKKIMQLYSYIQRQLLAQTTYIHSVNKMLYSTNFLYYKNINTALNYRQFTTVLVENQGKLANVVDYVSQCTSISINSKANLWHTKDFGKHSKSGLG